MVRKDKDLMLKEVERVIEQNPELDQVDLLATDLAGNFFGKRFPIEKLREFARNGLVMPRAMYVLSTVGESIYEHTGLGLSDGDPDCAVALVPGSVSVVDWGNRKRSQALLQTTGGDVLVDPRKVLSNVADSFQQRGLQPVAAFELEFTLYDNERTETGGVKPAANPKTGLPDVPLMLGAERIGDFDELLDEIITSCKSQRVETGAICAEYGPGQYEINFPHYDDVMLAADNAQLFKRTVKAVARNHGLRASFMAKPDPDQAGNGQHIHVSVIDKNGVNQFDGGDKPSDALMHAIGGLSKLAPEAMLFWAPNINSYRRFSYGNCVPTGATWAFENRMVAFRIPIATAGAWRIENRVPGADANCYLTLASMLAAMLHGIENKIAPPEESQGAPEMDQTSMPLTLRDAIEKTRNGAAIKKYMGDDFVSLYANYREGELQSFENHISSREIDWYL